MNPAGALQTADFFSARRQFARVVAADWRANRNDFLRALFYALAGFAFAPRASFPGRADLGVQFALLAVAAGCLAYQICAVENMPRASLFFFNLPRSRAIAWAAHVGLLAGALALLECLIFCAAALRINLPRGVDHYVFTPHLALLPFLSLAFCAWLFCQPRDIFEGLAPALVVITLLIVCLFIEIGDESPGFASEALLTFLVALFTCGFLLFSYLDWTQRQIGEQP